MQSESLPAWVARRLLPGEQQEIILRRHLAVLIPPAAATTGSLLVATAISATAQGNTPLRLVVWVLTAFLSLELVSAVTNWISRYIVVTNTRLLLISGGFSRRIVDLPLSTVIHMTFERSFSGRLFGYGTFVSESAGQGRSSLDFIPYPEQLYLDLCALGIPVERRPPTKNE
jgi:hypothetical protein